MKQERFDLAKKKIFPRTNFTLQFARREGVSHYPPPTRLMAQPRRILYVHNSADIYGASRSLVRLLSELHRDRFKPFVVLPSTGPLVPMIEKTRTEVIIHPTLAVIERSSMTAWRAPKLLLNFLVSSLFIRRVIKKFAIDLVHTNTGVMPSPAVAALLAGVPHIWHIRDSFSEFRFFWWLYSRYITSCSSAVLAVSEPIAAQFCDRSKIRVIHNGFALDEFSVPKEELARKFRRDWGLGSHFLVGCVGRIKLVRKGQEVLVNAMAHLCKTAPNARCVIVGSVFKGNEHHLEALKLQIHELGLTNNVIFTGEIADPRIIYAALDVFVLPSAQPEPFGGVVMEAMAMGVPVIATAIGGSVDQVDQGKTGFLVPPLDAEALAARLEELYNDNELRSRMAKSGPDRIRTHFALADKVAEIESVYKHAIDV